MATIHPTAIVDPRAQIADDVTIGPFTIIGPKVTIGAGSTVASHVVIEGDTSIGASNRIFQFAAIGGEPQDKKYRGEPTRLVIGDGNTIREGVTIHCGTVQDQGITRVGTDNWIMAYVHIAHDCVVGDHTILANYTGLAGHVQVGDWAILGGQTGVHQFCKIGAHAMTGAGSLVLQDIPPYVMSSGNPARPHGMNTEGLKRRGFAPETVDAIKRAYRTLYRSGLTLDDARARLREVAAAGGTTGEAVAVLAGFLDGVTRGIAR